MKTYLKMSSLALTIFVIDIFTKIQVAQKRKSNKVLLCVSEESTKSFVKTALVIK